MRRSLFLITSFVLVALILFAGCLGGKKEISEEQGLTSSQPQQHKESGVLPTLGEEIKELNVSTNENIDALSDDLYIESDIF